MSIYSLSVIITSRNEEFLKRTVEDVLDKRMGKTEVIVILDGALAKPALIQHPDVTVIYHKESVGQRAAINEGIKLSKAKYIMKLDAHCILDEGFDVKLIKESNSKQVSVPVQYNLHAFNWKCNKCKNEWYQSPTPKACMNPGEAKGKSGCDGKDFERVMVWAPRKGRKTSSWCFDKNLKFQYDGGIAKRQEGMIIETMSLIGACFFMERDWYWEIGGSEEEWGSWGQMGTELSAKSWLSGGKVIVNKHTWFAHMFRTQGGDFGFPYPQSGKQNEHARKRSREFFKEGTWKGEKPLHWLVEKFWPMKGWEEKDLIEIGGTVPKDEPEKGIIFYTDNQLSLKIARTVQKQLKSIGLPIVSSSLKPMNFGKNVHCKLKRGYMTMFKQILSALEAQNTKYVYFCEHDVKYHPSHFDFTPPRDDVWYYNTNMYKVSSADGRALWTDDCKQVSGICVNRETAVKHYKKRIEMLEKYTGDNFNGYVRAMGFEPATNHRKERVDDAKSENYMSKLPNIDIRHEANLTATRWSPDKFRNKKFTKGWKECHVSEIPGWKMEQFPFLK